MSKVREEIDAGLRAFIERQQLFFVGTSPLDAAGHVNISPKGLDVMPHQSRFLEAVRTGHRSFLLADEPGLAQAMGERARQSVLQTLSPERAAAALINRIEQIHQQRGLTSAALPMQEVQD